MLRHHLSIVMLRIFADIAHVWQLAIGTRFVEQYLTNTHPACRPRRRTADAYRRVVQAAYPLHGDDGLEVQQRDAGLSLM